MDTPSGGSVTHWLDALKEGDDAAAQKLWDRYFAQLTAVAQSRLRSMPRDVAGEDVALSALNSMMAAVKARRFPDLTDRNSLWPLLVTITARKSIKQVRRQTAAKRTTRRTQPLDIQRDVVKQEPTAEFAIEVADQLEHLVLRFDDPHLRLIARRKLEGYTNAEIADELDCSTRTVIRKLDRIRREWEEPDDDAID